MTLLESSADVRGERAQRLSSGGEATPSVGEYPGYFTPPANLADDLPPEFERVIGVYAALPKDEALREIRYIAENVPLCQSCELRSATVVHFGHQVCASCAGASL